MVRGRNDTVAASLERHAARADELRPQASTVRAQLEFASKLLRAQAQSAACVETTADAGALSGRLDSDLDRVLATLRDVAEFAAREGPAALREEARARCQDTEATARTRLELYWRGDRQTSDDYLSRAMLRPYVQVLRERGVRPGRELARGRCPFCGGIPALALRRSSSESDGAARSLVCGLCDLEWTFQRIVCPACFEQTPAKLPSYASDAHPNVRIEACETCRRYVKSLDVTRNPRAAPEVDDLVTLALDLWATEQGFVRIEPGLAGI